VEELEKQLIVESMEKTQDNQTKAAEILGISERMLRYKLKKYGLKN
jgi:two-component system NtrC family response regulator